MRLTWRYYPPTLGGTRRNLALLCLLAMGAALLSLGAAPQQPAPQALLGEARALLEDGRLAAAAASLEALARSESPAATAELRQELRDAAEALRGGAARADAIARARGALESAQKRLAATAALGLDLQPSLSRTPPKEPAYGGHASAVAPPRSAAPDPLASSPVALEERTRLPVKTWCGGATKDHIHRVRRQRRRALRLRRRRAPGHLPGQRVRAGRRHASTSRTRNALFRTSATGSSRTSRRRPGSTSPRGATACAPATTTTTGASTSTSPTGGRTSCSATRATAASARRGARGRGGRGLEHGLRVLRRRRGRRPRPVRRPLRQRDLGRRQEGGAHADVARRTQGHGRPRGPAGRGRPLLREPGRRVVP